MRFLLPVCGLLLAALPAQAEEISVTQYGASLYGAPYAVAMQEGLFKKAGIDITGILGSGGGGTTVRNILASDTPVWRGRRGGGAGGRTAGAGPRHRQCGDAQRGGGVAGDDA